MVTPDLSLEELIALLSSPEGKLRDDLAYTEISERIGAGLLDANLAELGDRFTAGLLAPTIEARSFSSLGLTCVVGRLNRIDELPRGVALRWAKNLIDWYIDEPDERGWTEELGWLHSVAHGADALAALGASSSLTGDDLEQLLEALASRLLSTTKVFLDLEDDRVGRAAALILTRPELSTDQAVKWLSPIAVALAKGEPGAVPAWVSNCLRTLRVLYIAADRGLTDAENSTVLVLPHGATVCEAVVDTIKVASPYSV